MKTATCGRTGLFSLALAVLPLTAVCQSFVSPAPPSEPADTGAVVRPGVTPPVTNGLRPFSRVALGANISPLGVGAQVVTNINRHLNLRANGDMFSYTTGNITTNCFNVTGKLNLASARISADYYPFRFAWRLSPGVLMYNGNHATATFQAPPGESFTLDNTTFYSASGANAVVGNGRFGLGNGSPAFTMTTGWGNQIPAKGGHWSFPVEVGVAFIQQPTVSLVLSGEVCDQNGANCVDVATDPYAQEALAAQVKKYRDNIEQLKTYPIVSFGVSYSFGTRRVY